MNLVQLDGREIRNSTGLVVGKEEGVKDGVFRKEQGWFNFDDFDYGITCWRRWLMDSMGLLSVGCLLLIMLGPFLL